MENRFDENFIEKENSSAVSSEGEIVLPEENSALQEWNEEFKRDKKKKKRKKRLVITAFVLAILFVAGAIAYRIAMNYVGDKLVNVLLKQQLNGMLDSGEITLEDLVGILTDTEPSAETEEPTVAENEAEEPDNVTEEEGGEGEETTSSQKPSQSKAPAAAKPKQESSGQTTQNRNDIVQKTADKIENSIPRSDKDEMVALIRSRLTSGDIKRLAELARGGLSNDELGECVRIAEARFSGAELERVKDFWHRYQSRIRTYK